MNPLIIFFIALAFILILTALLMLYKDKVCASTKIIPNFFE